MLHYPIDVLIGAASKFRVDNTGAAIFAGDVTVPDEAYGPSFNGSLEVLTKNAIWDKLETPSFGQMNFEDSVFVINPSGVTPITNLAKNLFTDVVDQGSITLQGDSCIIGSDGAVSFDLSIVLESVGGVYTIGLSKNGTVVNNLSSHAAFSATTGTKAIPLNYTYIATAGDVIKPIIVQVSGADPTVVDGSFTVHRL